MKPVRVVRISLLFGAYGHIVGSGFQGYRVSSQGITLCGSRLSRLPFRQKFINSVILLHSTQIIVSFIEFSILVDWSCSGLMEDLYKPLLKLRLRLLKSRVEIVSNNSHNSWRQTYNNRNKLLHLALVRWYISNKSASRSLHSHYDTAAAHFIVNRKLSFRHYTR